MRRREFIAALGVAAAWPMVARGQQASMPVVGFLHVGPADAIAFFVAPFRKGLNEAGYAEGKNVTVEYHRVGGKDEHLQAVIADLVHRQVAVIVTPGGVVHALAAKAATATIPIVSLAKTQSSLVSSPASPGLAATPPASILSAGKWWLSGCGS